MDTIHTKEHQTLVALIVRERRRRNLLQGLVARRLGVHQSWLARVEGGQRRVDVPEFIRIARAIGFDPIKAMRTICKC